MIKDFIYSKTMIKYFFYSKLIIKYFLYSITILLLISSIFIINDMFFSIRLQEIDFKFIDHNNSKKKLDHIALVALYNLQKMKYEQIINEDQADLQEIKIRSMIFNETEPKVFKTGKYGILIKPAIIYMNLLRRITGKPLINTHEKNIPGTQELDNAYYLERNFIFKEAITYYNLALEKGSFASDIEAGINLHIGYCHALIGDTKKAKKIYKNIIQKYGDLDIGVTATLLLSYLNKFESEQMKIISSNENDYQKSEKLLQLMAYEKALKLLEKNEYSSSGESLRQIKYYKAICLEKLGQKQQSIEILINLIVSSPDSKYGKISNRRLYIISHFLRFNPQLKKISEDINQFYDDPIVEKFPAINNDLDINNSNDTAIISLSNNTIKKVNKFIIKMTRVKGLKSKPYSAIIFKVTMKNGDFFIGTILKKTSKYIILNTAVGTVQIELKNILLIND